MVLEDIPILLANSSGRPVALLRISEHIRSIFVKSMSANIKFYTENIFQWYLITFISLKSEVLPFSGLFGELILNMNKIRCKNKRALLNSQLNEFKNEKNSIEFVIG